MKLGGAHVPVDDHHLHVLQAVRRRLRRARTPTCAAAACPSPRSRATTSGAHLRPGHRSVRRSQAPDAQVARAASLPAEHRRATSGDATAHAASTTHDGPGRSPQTAERLAQHVGERRRRQQRAPPPGSAPGSSPNGMTMPPSSSSTRYSPFCAARLISPRSRPAKRQADAGERDRAEQRPRRRRASQLRLGRGPAERVGHRARARRTAPARPPATADDLGRDQPGATERRGAESLQHVVGALEAGADAEAHHRRAHHRQRQHAGARKSTGSSGCRVGQHVDEAEEHEQQHGDAEREQQLLAVAGHQLQLGAHLRQPSRCVESPSVAPSRRLPGAVVSRRNTSSSRCAPARRSVSG